MLCIRRYTTCCKITLGPILDPTTGRLVSEAMQREFAPFVGLSEADFEYEDRLGLLTDKWYGRLSKKPG